MWIRPLFLRGASLAAQLALIIAGLATLYGNPPASGRILLVPLTHHAQLALVPMAVQRGARLVAGGRLAGSMVVEARRSNMLPLLRAGIVPLRAFSAACGETVEGLA